MKTYMKSGSLKSKRGLKAKAPLSSHKPLQAKVGLKTSNKASKPKKPRLRTISVLRREADKWYSWAIRLRDSELVEGVWVATCISCPKQYTVRAEDKWTNQMDNGHFVSRGYLKVRYNDRNCHAQCKRCNKWLNGNLVAYREALDERYGTGTADWLEQLALTNKAYSLKRDELEEIIARSKREVDRLLGM